MRLLIVLSIFLSMQTHAQLVINEILFNPRTGGSDYVELYNKTDTTVDLKNFYLTSKTTSGYGVLKKLCDSTRLLLPKGFVVITEDSTDLAQQFFLKDPSAVLMMEKMPAYPNEKGTVVLMDSAKNIVDEVAYNEGWQGVLLNDAEGVALERIDVAGASNNKDNWRSAAADAGYGTPGYANSQAQLFENPMILFTLQQPFFSPDGDGVADEAQLAYATAEGGAMVNIYVLDVQGRRRAHWIKNSLLGTRGRFAWNGKDDGGQLLPNGQYIFYIEVFNTTGKVWRFKKVVALARR